MLKEAEVCARIEHFDRDQKYIEAHRQEWLEKYPEQWVAVYGEELLGVADTLPAVLAQAKKKGVTTDVAVRLLTRDPRLLLL